MLHSGIDLHKRDLVIATTDSAGVIVHRGKVPATRPAVAAYFRALGPDQRAVVESTATWYAVVVPPIISGRARAQPVMVYGRHCGDPRKRCWRAGY